MESQGPVISLFPVIDFTKINLIDPGTEEWNSLRSQVGKALEEHGFFMATYKVPDELETAICDELKQLFDQQKSSSGNIEALKKSFRYFKFPNLRLYESIVVRDPLDLKSLEKLEKDLWPQGRPSFSNTIQGFQTQVVELEKLVRRMAVESLGLEKYLDEELMKSVQYNIMAMKYGKPQTINETEVGLSAHKDKNLLSILHQNQVGGLELQTGAGDWISATLSPDSFVVLAGDAFHAWTNGRVPAAIHRVMMKGEEERCSIGVFSSFSPGHLIESPKELVDEEHPALFKPFKYGDYIKFVEMKLGKGPATATLDEFCRVSC